MIGTLELIQVEDLLKNQIVGRLGCSTSDETYIVPISYAYDGNYIYCHTIEGKKTEILRKNPKVCFQVDEMKDMGNWKSVIVQGVYEELKNPEDRTFAMKILLQRYLPIISSVTTHLGQNWPFQPDDLNEIKGIVFRIAVKEKTGRFEENIEKAVMAG